MITTDSVASAGINSQEEVDPMGSDDEEESESPVSLSRKVAIGIDLGITSSAVGVWRNERVEIIPNARGQRRTPSYIAFTDGGTLIGDEAKSQMEANPENTIWEFKILLGRSFDDPLVQEGRKHWPFQVVNVGGKPCVEVMVDGEIKHFTAEELTCMMLVYLKRAANAYLKREVTDAVVTIPAGFNSLQRWATKKAAELAGLKVLRFISGPTAAAFTYVELTRKIEFGIENSKNLLIFNVEGGITDVSVVTVEDGIVDVRATRGNIHLGGEHFVTRLLNLLCQEIQRKFKVDIRDNPRALLRLRTECENLKMLLSRSDAIVNVHIYALLEDIDFDTNMSRASLRQLGLDLFPNVIDLVSPVLRFAGMKKGDIHEILLVGDSTHMPKIRKLIRGFEGKELNKSIHPVEAPVHGVALYAARLSGFDNPILDELLLLDVTPFSLGVETTEGEMNTLIYRCTTIPTKSSGTFTTVYDNQSTVIISIYEGERALVKDNSLLGTFSLSDIPPAPAGVPQIMVTFDIDANGILQVTAVEKSTGKVKRIQIVPGNEDLIAEEEIVKKLINDAKANKLQEFQDAYASIKSSYQTLRSLCSDAPTYYFDQKIHELYMEKKRMEPMLTSKKFPIVEFTIPDSTETEPRPTLLTICDAVGQPGGGSDSLKRNRSATAVGKKYREQYQNVYKGRIALSSKDTFCVECDHAIEVSKTVSDMKLVQNDKGTKSKPGSPSNEASETNNSSGSSDSENSDVIFVSSDGGNCTGSAVTKAHKRKIPETKRVANPPDNKRRRTQQNSVKNGVLQEEVTPKGSDRVDEDDESEVKDSGTDSEPEDDGYSAGENSLTGMKEQMSGKSADQSIHSAAENCKMANVNYVPPVAPINLLPTPPEALRTRNDEATTRQEDCSVMMALRKMYDGGRLLDDSLTIFNKQPVQIVNIMFNTSIFRLWRIICPEDAYRRQAKSDCALNIDGSGIKTLMTFATYLHTGYSLTPAQLLDFLGGSPITLTDPFIVGLIILQSVFEMGAEDCKTLQSKLIAKEDSREAELLAQCLKLQTDRERMEMIMTMFSSMRKLSSRETTFYLWMRQNQKVLYTKEERRLMFYWLYSKYSNSPETPPIRILLANLTPDSSDEADLELWCKDKNNEMYNFKYHSIMLMLHQYQEPGKVNSNFKAMVNKIRGNLGSRIIDKMTMTSFTKIMYKMGGNDRGKIDISIKMLVDLSELFCISNPMEMAFGRLLPDSGINFRMFLDFFDATEEAKYLKDILCNPLTYLTTCNTALLTTKQMECILQSDDLKMPEMDVYKLFICFAKSKACPDEDEQLKQVPQRVKYLVKFVRFGLIEKGDFQEVEKEKLIPVDIKMTFSYHLKCPGEEINVPDYMHKPFVKRNL